MPGSLNLLPEMLKNDSDFTNPAVLVLALKNTMSNTPASNAPMSNAAIEKAALAITKLEGHDNWICWSANIEMVLDHTWEFVEGGRTSLLRPVPPEMERPLGASRLGLSHWAGPSVTRSAGWSQRWYGGIIVDILAKESKFP